MKVDCILTYRTDAQGQLMPHRPAPAEHVFSADYAAPRNAACQFCSRLLTCEAIAKMQTECEKTQKGQHYDSGKPPLDLFPPEALVAASEVMGHGAKKYARHNWRGGIEWSRLLASALRHLTAWNAGEDIDPESGFNHLAHAECDIAMLLTSVLQGYGTDDRYRKPAPGAGYEAT